MNSVYGTADHHYRSGFYRPGPNDPEFRPSGGDMPCGHLPRTVAMHPAHVPSTVVFIVRLRDHTGAFGGRRPRWRRTTRTECACGKGWGRTRTVDVRHLDDVTVRGMHVTHTLHVARRAETRKAA